MRALLRRLRERARERGKAFLMLGLADDDPLLAVARRWLHVTYRSDLFALAWDGASDAGRPGRAASRTSRSPPCDRGPRRRAPARRQP